MSIAKHYDVIVVGAGNAGLCAALSAVEHGGHVLVLEKAPEYLRGGNSYFTGGAFRFPYNGIDDIKKIIPDLSERETEQIEIGQYTEDDFYNDLMRVTEGLADPELAQVLVTQANPAINWMAHNGIAWALLYGRQAFKVGDKYRFWGGLVLESNGGGKGLIDRLFEIVQQRGIDVLYESRATKLLMATSGHIRGVTVRGPEGFRDITGEAVILASGGFEANPEMRSRYLGPDWELAKVRGVRFNTGEGIRMALDIGAQPFGHWSSCHAVAWDLNAPPYGDRNVADLFQKHSYPFGIVVNVRGERFLDEGADFRNYTYAQYGREILKQPQRAAFQVFDDKVKHLLRDEYRISQVTMATANTIEELANRLDIDREGLARTVREFNEAVQEKEFNPTILDGKCTKGITPPKSNWALPIDTPPYLGYAVTCGITFTFGGLRINTSAQVMDTEDSPLLGLYACGELVGGLFYYNYAGGTGLTAGSVFGKIAGASAAKKVKAATKS